jgi:hypothetical protein
VQKLQHSNTIVCGLSPSTSILFRAPHELLADWNLVCAANAQVCPMLLAIALVPPVTRSDVLNLFFFLVLVLICFYIADAPFWVCA